MCLIFLRDRAALECTPRAVHAAGSPSGPRVGSCSGCSPRTRPARAWGVVGRKPGYKERLPSAFSAPVLPNQTGGQHMPHCFQNLDLAHLP